MPGNDYVAVRTLRGMRIFAADYGTEEAYSMGDIHMRQVKDAPLSSLVLDMAMSRVLPGHMAAVQEGGAVLIWDARYEGIVTWRTTMEVYDESVASLENDKLRWKACQFAAHPRTLTVGHAQYIELCDLRTVSVAQPSILFDAVPQGELFTGLDHNPQSPFQLVVTSTDRTYLLDTRYPNHILLQWALNNPRETQTHVAHLPSLSHKWTISSPGSHASSTFMSWGSQMGEVVLTTYEETPPAPPVSRGACKLASFAAHPHSVMPPLDSVSSLGIPPVLDYEVLHVETENKAPWPHVLGCVAVPHGLQDSGAAASQSGQRGSGKQRDEDDYEDGQEGLGFTVVHLAADGAMYAQAYGPPIQHQHQHKPGMTRKWEARVGRVLDSIESAVADTERREFGGKAPPPETLRDHPLYEFRPLAKLTNRWVQEQMDRDAVAPNGAVEDTRFDVTAVKLNGSIQLLADLVADDNDTRAFTLDEASGRVVLPPLVPSVDAVANAMRRLDSITSTFSAQVDDPRLLRLTYRVDNWTVEDTDPADGTQQPGVSSDADSLHLDTIRARLAAEFDSRPLPATAPITSSIGIHIDNTRGIEWLARDLALSQYAYLPRHSRVSLDLSKVSHQDRDQLDQDWDPADDADTSRVWSQASMADSMDGRGSFHGSLPLSGSDSGGPSASQSFSQRASFGNDGSSGRVLGLGKRYKTDTDGEDSDERDGRRASQGRRSLGVRDDDSYNDDDDDDGRSVVSTRSRVSAVSAASVSQVTDQPLDKMPSVLRTPVIDKTIAMTGAVSTLHDMWERPGLYYPSVTGGDRQDGGGHQWLEPAGRKAQAGGAAEGRPSGTGASTGTKRGRKKRATASSVKHVPPGVLASAYTASLESPGGTQASHGGASQMTSASSVSAPCIKSAGSRVSTSTLPRTPGVVASSASAASLQSRQSLGVPQPAGGSSSGRFTVSAMSATGSDSGSARVSAGSLLLSPIQSRSQQQSQSQSQASQSQQPTQSLSRLSGVSSHLGIPGRPSLSSQPLKKKPRTKGF
ncbi:hypothetical protein BC831DRAFT_128837 [Entophlyctis helioformis]|nr:hypothetical protein BC831DRAFT_128837 [Entophlyctis helioformis]